MSQITKINSSTPLAKDLCDALGIPFIAIRDIEIICRFDDVAILKLEKVVTADEAEKIKIVINKYELTKK